jgi:hypothetical protein
MEMAKRQLVKATPSGSAKLYDDGTILLNDVRLSRVFLRKPRDYKGDGNFKYQLFPLLDKANPKHMEAVELMKEHIKSLMADAKIKKLPADAKSLVDLDAKAARDEVEADFPNHWGVSCKENPEDAPLLYDKDGLNIGRDPQGVIYAGCRGDVILRYYITTQYGDRLCSGVSSVRFRGDGEPLGRRRAKDGDFDDIWDEDDDSTTGAASKASNNDAIDDDF